MKKEKLYGIEAFRVLSILIIFLFHCNIHIGCTFGILTPFISQGAIFMDAFFLISGFVIHYNYFDRLKNIDEVFAFYKKRLLSLYPLYLIVITLYTIFYIDNLSVFKHILIAPIELFLLQAHFSSLFFVLHNDGTWFLSCIFFCYLLFPLLLFISNRLKNVKHCLTTLFLIYSLYSISQIVAKVFQTEQIYSSPFFRMMVFLMGMILALIFKISKENGVIISNRLSIFTGLFSLLLLAFIITILVKCGILCYLYYSFVALPIFYIILLTSAFANDKKNKIFSYINKGFYSFFLAQLFTFDFYKYLKSVLNFKIRNKLCIIVLFIICLSIAGLLKIIEVNFKKLLRRFVDFRCLKI